MSLLAFAGGTEQERKREKERLALATKQTFPHWDGSRNSYRLVQHLNCTQCHLLLHQQVKLGLMMIAGIYMRKDQKSKTIQCFLCEPSSASAKETIFGLNGQCTGHVNTETNLTLKAKVTSGPKGHLEWTHWLGHLTERQDSKWRIKERERERERVSEGRRDGNALRDIIELDGIYAVMIF